MKKIVVLIGFILLLGIVFVFSQVLGKIVDKTQSNSPSEREVYVSQIIVTIPWGNKENQIEKEHIPSSFGVSPDGQSVYVPDRYKKRNSKYPIHPDRLVTFRQ